MTPILIPTYRRVKTQLTYHALPQHLRKHITFCVRKDEAAEMTDLYPDASVHVLTPRATSYTKTMSEVWELGCSMPSFTYVDDDLKFMRWRTWDGVNYRMGPCEEWDDLFDRIDNELTNPKVGICQPVGMWHRPKTGGFGDGRLEYHKTVQWMSCSGSRVKHLDWEALGHNECSDFDVVLQCLTSGLETVAFLDRLVRFELMGKNAGGCNDDVSRKDKVLDARKALAAKWPLFVKAKSDGDFRSVQWSRALKYGSKK